MASFVYNKGLEEIGDGTIDWVANTIKCMLLTTDTITYVPNRDHDVVDNAAGDNTDPSACEAGLAGLDNYTAGFAGTRKTLAGPKTVQESEANDQVRYFAADLDTGAGNQWVTLGGTTDETINYAIVYFHNTSDTDSRLLCLIDLTPLTTNGSDVEITFDVTNVSVFYLDTAPA